MRKRKYKRTKISLGILAALLIASILYEFIGPDDYRTMIQQLQDEDGKLLENPPYPPGQEYLLGTDRDGRDNLLLIIDGIKYTFAAVVAASFLRVAIGTLIGIIIEMWIPAFKSFVKAFFLPFQYVPILLIGVLFMDALVFEYNEIPVLVKVEYQLIVLFLLGFPTVFFFTADFIKEIKTRSYVTSSFMLGGSKMHILLKQILPHLKPQLALLFVQQVLQTMQVMLGLAMFNLFLGGPDRETIYDTNYKKSVTNELAALTGQNFWFMKYAPWIALSSLFMLLILFILVIVIKNELVENILGKAERFGDSTFMENRLENGKVALKKETSPGKFIPLQKKVLDQ